MTAGASYFQDLSTVLREGDVVRVFGLLPQIAAFTNAGSAE